MRLSETCVVPPPVRRSPALHRSGRTEGSYFTDRSRLSWTKVRWWFRGSPLGRTRKLADVRFVTNCRAQTKIRHQGIGYLSRVGRRADPIQFPARRVSLLVGPVPPHVRRMWASTTLGETGRALAGYSPIGSIIRLASCAMLTQARLVPPRHCRGGEGEAFPLPSARQDRAFDHVCPEWTFRWRVARARQTEGGRLPCTSWYWFAYRALRHRKNLCLRECGTRP
jgi:hypothetical protein